MAKRTHQIDTLAASRLAGLGCFVLLVLTCLLSNPIAFDNTSAFEFQLPLTAAGGIGLLLGFCACCFVYRMKRLFLDAPLEKIGRFALCLSCGLTASILVRSGLIFDAAPYDLLVGSALESAVLLFAAYIGGLFSSASKTKSSSQTPPNRCSARQSRFWRYRLCPKVFHFSFWR